MVGRWKVGEKHNQLFLKVEVLALISSSGKQGLVKVILCYKQFVNLPRSLLNWYLRVIMLQQRRTHGKAHSGKD